MTGFPAMVYSLMTSMTFGRYKNLGGKTVIEVHLKEKVLFLWLLKSGGALAPQLPPSLRRPCDPVMTEAWDE